VSMFHSILCLIAQESRVGRKGSVLEKNYTQFWVDRTSPGVFLKKSETVPGGLVQTGFFISTFDDCFECNLLTVSLIDLILVSLAS
jgi:hypothetical protein